MEIIKKNKKQHNKKKLILNSKFFYLNLLIIILIIFLFFTFYFKDSFFKKNNFYLSGETNNFNLNFSNNLILESSNFDFKNSNLFLKEEKGKLNITNFKGFLTIKNESFILNGTCETILINKNKINNVSNFIIIFHDLNLEFKNLDLDIFFNKGNLRINNKQNLLSYNFKNSSILIKKFSGKLELKNKKIYLKGDIKHLNLISNHINLNFKTTLIHKNES